jgi:hypothetical protein
MTAALLLAPLQVRAQAAAPAGTNPATTLADTLIAACRQDQAAFVTHLTAQNGAAYRELPATQRVAFMQRLALLEAPGKPLRSTAADGRTVVRCEAAGAVSEMRFGAPEVRDNLSFVSVEVPQAGEAGDTTRSVRFGLVREAGEWKLLSVGLLLVDVPAMAQEWAEAGVRAHDAEIVTSMHKIADALHTYQSAYGRLPEALEQLGPAPKEGISPERAGLLDEPLSAGESGGYRFRYVIVPAAGPGDESERDKAAGFSLAATPAAYSKATPLSFYLDWNGVLRGADKHGEVATILDPRMDEPRP